MNIYIFKNEQYTGPYTTDEVQSRLKSGAFALTDLAWHEGCGDPIPLARVLRDVVSSTMKTQTTDFSPSELIKIAQQQKGFISTMLVYIGLLLLSMMIDLGSAERPMFLAVGMMCLGYGWRLTRALRKNPWIWTLLMLLPFVCWFFYARLIWTATKILKANGVPCGIFGAETAAINRLVKQ
jgi:hypothetical protein